MRRLFAVIVLALLIAGCAKAPEPAPEAPAPVPEAPAPVGTELNVVAAPSTATVGESLQFRWEVKAAAGKNTIHTAVHYGRASAPGELGKDVAPAATAYTDLTQQFASGEFALPREFASGFIPVSPGMVYFRYHAVVDGENYWSSEYSVDIAPLVVEEEPVPEEPVPQESSGPDHVIVVSDTGFEPATLTVKVGDTVQWKSERTKYKAKLLKAPRSTGTDFPLQGEWIPAGGTWEFTFQKEGELIYSDAIFTTLAGELTVEP